MSHGTVFAAPRFSLRALRNKSLQLKCKCPQMQLKSWLRNRLSWLRPVRPLKMLLSTSRIWLPVARGTKLPKLKTTCAWRMPKLHGTVMHPKISDADGSMRLFNWSTRRTAMTNPPAKTTRLSLPQHVAPCVNSSWLNQTTKSSTLNWWSNFRTPSFAPNRHVMQSHLRKHPLSWMEAPAFPPRMLHPLVMLFMASARRHKRLVRL